MLIRKSCFSCKYSDIPRIADLTVGDYWGIPSKDDDGKGTSVVIVNSEKGVRVVELLDKLRLDEIEFQRIKDNNRIQRKFELLNRERYTDYIKLGKKVKDVLYEVQNDIFDVGLVIHTSYNFGNNLTNYSLYRAISRMGYSATFLTETGSFYSMFASNPYPKYVLPH